MLFEPASDGSRWGGPFGRGGPAGGKHLGNVAEQLNLESSPARRPDASGPRQLAAWRRLQRGNAGAIHALA